MHDFTLERTCADFRTLVIDKNNELLVSSLPYMAMVSLIMLGKGITNTDSLETKIRYFRVSLLKSSKNRSVRSRKSGFAKHHLYIPGYLLIFS